MFLLAPHLHPPQVWALHFPLVLPARWPPRSTASRPAMFAVGLWASFMVGSVMQSEPLIFHSQAHCLAFAAAACTETSHPARPDCPGSVPFPTVVLAGGRAANIQAILCMRWDLNFLVLPALRRQA